MENIYDASWAELLEDDLNSHSSERITDFISFIFSNGKIAEKDKQRCW